MGKMINELPLELLIHILDQFNVKELIKLRAVCKKWRLVIDQYLLLELNIFDNYHTGLDIFLKQLRNFSNPKNAINCGVLREKNHKLEWKVNLDKLKFLFRNVRKLLLFLSVDNPVPMTDFISE